MRDAPELKPCPFCGGEARLVTHRTGEDSMGAYVYCKDCATHSEHFEDAYAPASEAIAAWNTRADLTAAAVTAALQGAVDALPEPDRFVIEGSREHIRSSAIHDCRRAIFALMAKPTKVTP